MNGMMSSGNEMLSFLKRAKIDIVVGFVFMSPLPFIRVDIGKN
jgi:hypothetical protein